MKKSRYSGMFGDYSSYSAEYDEISDADYDPEAALEVEEVSFKTLAAVGQSRRGRQSRARADHDRVRGIELMLQSVELFFLSADAVGSVAEYAQGVQSVFDGFLISVRQIVISIFHDAWLLIGAE